MDRSELLSTYTEYVLSRPIPESPEKAEGGMSVEELELRRRKEERLQQELELLERGTADAERDEKTGI